MKPVLIELTDFKTKEKVDELEVDAVMVATGRAPFTQVSPNQTARTAFCLAAEADDFVINLLLQPDSTLYTAAKALYTLTVVLLIAVGILSQ